MTGSGVVWSLPKLKTMARTDFGRTITNVRRSAASPLSEVGTCGLIFSLGGGTGDERIQLVIQKSASVRLPTVGKWSRKKPKLRKMKKMRLMTPYDDHRR